MRFSVIDKKTGLYIDTLSIMQIPIAWVEEYNELVKKIEERKEE